MNVEELIAGLKEKGLNDEEIKAELQKIVEDIEAFLEPDEKPEEVKKEEETDEEKEHRVFGI